MWVVLLLGGCTPQIRRDNDYSLQREAISGTHKPVPEPLNINTGQQGQSLATSTAPQEQYGTGVFINPAAAKGKSGGAANAGGDITFNFDNQPVQAAVKAILGDVLHANYSISPDVKGTVTFATSQPVTQAEVLPILQMLLSWTGNALIQRDGGYVVVPVDQAAAGNLVPGLGAVSPGAGYAARLFPLHYVSAPAMQELLKPFANPKAFLLVDPLRNLLVMGGTPDELANYQRIIQTFDVDWLRGMSVDVIPLQHVQAEDLVNQLNTLFTEQGGGSDKGANKPVSVPGSNVTVTFGNSKNSIGQAGNLSSMVRLIPLKQSNSLVVITSQPTYIDEVRRLVTVLDNGAGSGADFYVYNVVNMKAASLAQRLNTLYESNVGNEQSANDGAVAPGFTPQTQATPGRSSIQQGFGTFSSDSGVTQDTLGSNSVARNGVIGTSAGHSGHGQPAEAQGSTYTIQEGVRVVADNENNQLLIRAAPSQWETLLPVLRRLDEKPLQVQIETRVLEVNLTGEFQFGVQYYLGGLIGTQTGSPPNTNESYHRHQGAAGLGGVDYNSTSDALFYSFAGSNLQFALKALETSGDAKVLSAPSTVVLNNQETTFKVGEKIPVVQNYYVPGLGVGSSTGDTSVGQVQYIDTGVLLDVVPRVSPGGLVYLNVQQVVSEPTTKDNYGNYTIANRALSTEVAVQSGRTVLLGGLIQQTDTTQDNGVPFLNRIPFLGRLFGTTDRNKSRTELIVLITPRIIRNPEDARRITDEYESQFESLKPILPKPGAVPAADSYAGTPSSDITSLPAIPASAVTAPVQDSAAATPSGKWLVRVATFTNNGDAEKLRQHLQQSGYTSYVQNLSDASHALWRVCAGPVINRESAELLRDAIAGDLHIPGMQVANH